MYVESTTKSASRAVGDFLIGPRDLYLGRRLEIADHQSTWSWGGLYSWCLWGPVGPVLG